MKKNAFLIFVIFILTQNITYGQCSGGVAGANIAPTSTWQTVSVSSGTYYSFNAVAGGVYTFTFCQGGGGASYDTYISIETTANVNIGYNDDNCATLSEYTFIAPSTGTFRVYITEWTSGSGACTNSAKSATLAFRVLNDNICQAIPLTATVCACSYSTFSNTNATASPQANPGCSYNGGDVWFKTRVPFSGQVTITSSAGTMTDGSMAVYSSNTNTCSGTLSLINCNDNFGASLMPKLVLTNLTPGDSIYIRFYSKSNLQTGTFNLCVQDGSAAFCMAGSATEMYPSRCVQITPNAPGQAGCVWNTSKINLAASFDYNFTVFLGAADGGADGITFAMQDSPAGASACGGTGQDIGMGGVTRSVVVEFDTYNNDYMGYTNDIAADHIAISLNGNINAAVAGPIQASATNVNIEDGVNHAVRIVWTQSTKLFEVYFDGVLRLSYTNDIVTNVFTGTNMVYWGMTGSTGGFYNQQTLCPGNLPGSPLPLTFFNGFLKNEKDIEFNWTYTQAEDVRSFTLEQSVDGVDFHAVYHNTQINPSLNNHYSWILGNVTEGAYYRLVTTKKNGSSETSSIIYIDPVQLQAKEYQIYPNPSDVTEINIIGQESESAEVIIRNVMGDEISRYAINQLYNTVSLPSNMTNGSYIVSITTLSKSHNYHFTLAR